MTPSKMPTSGADWAALAEHHLVAQQLAEAIACYARAVELEPNAWNYRARLGRLFMAIRQFDAAEAELRCASNLKPDVPDLLVLHAYALREENQPEAAVSVLERALALDPRHMHAAIAEALMLPPIYSGTEDLEGWRERFASGLARLHARNPAGQQDLSPILDLQWTNFLLAYQGQNDVALQRSYSRLISTLLRAAVPELHHPMQRSQDACGKIRVGFLSSEFRASTIGGYFHRWITDLPRDRFEVSTFHTGSAKGELTREFERGSDRFIPVTGNADIVARALRAESLDVAVLLDVGMSAKSMLLANLRLARVQCAAWGHPVTTGSEFVDYFISGEAMEPEGAQTHYVERC